VQLIFFGSAGACPSMEAEMVFTGPIVLPEAFTVYAV